MARVRTGRLALMIGGAALLTGCEEGRKFGLFKKKPAAPATETMLEAPESIETTRLDPIAAAGAALDRVEADKVTGTPVPGLAPAPKPSNLDKPYIQIGLFSVEDNANRTGTVLRGAGVAPTIVKDAATRQDLLAGRRGSGLQLCRPRSSSKESEGSGLYRRLFRHEVTANKDTTTRCSPA